MTEQNDNNQLLEIYKLHAELADRVSQRREGANRLYVSIITAFLAAIVFIARWGDSSLLTNPVLLLCGGIVGMGICISWYIVIRSYRQLNSGKFAALDELESKLPYPFFRREWEILDKGGSFKKYWRLTIAETILPIIFGMIYLSLSVYGMRMLYCTCAA